MSCQKIKYKRLIYVQIITDVEIYLGIVKVLTRSQKVNILDVGLWYTPTICPNITDMSRKYSNVSTRLVFMLKQRNINSTPSQ